MGITFKENCPDVRNTKVIDVIDSLKAYGVNICVYDPCADPVELKNEYGLISLRKLPKDKFDAVVLAVAHKSFLEIDFSIIMKPKCVLYDVKNVLPKSITDKSL